MTTITLDALKVPLHKLFPWGFLKATFFKYLYLFLSLFPIVILLSIAFLLVSLVFYGEYIQKIIEGPSMLHEILVYQTSGEITPFREANPYYIPAIYYLQNALSAAGALFFIVIPLPFILKRLVSIVDEKNEVFNSPRVSGAWVKVKRAWKNFFLASIIMLPLGFFFSWLIETELSHFMIIAAHVMFFIGLYWLFSSLMRRSFFNIVCQYYTLEGDQEQIRQEFYQKVRLVGLFIVLALFIPVVRYFVGVLALIYLTNLLKLIAERHKMLSVEAQP